LSRFSNNSAIVTRCPLTGGFGFLLYVLRLGLLKKRNECVRRQLVVGAPLAAPRCAASNKVNSGRGKECISELVFFCHPEQILSS